MLRPESLSEALIALMEVFCKGRISYSSSFLYLPTSYISSFATSRYKLVTLVSVKSISSSFTCNSEFWEYFSKSSSKFEVKVSLYSTVALSSRHEGATVTSAALSW